MGFSLIPRNDAYFDDFREASQLVLEIAQLMFDGVQAPTLPADLGERIHAVEARAHEVQRRCLHRLDTSFITPIEREDIHLLILTILDVAEMIEAAASRFEIYGIAGGDDPLRQMMGKVLEMAKIMEEAVGHLRTLDPARVRASTQRLRALEEEVDDIYRAALKALFARRPEAYELVARKELYDYVEEAADKARAVARTVDHILVRHS
jgi:uncharacterized protein Yka (UPF0111/DUF47 family)